MDPRAVLLGKLTRIFSDATVDDAERAELRAFLASGELSATELKEVFESFVATTWRATIADDHVSEVEKKRLREVVRVLGLDASLLPREWLAAVRG
jgi:tellurite resistance protein